MSNQKLGKPTDQRLALVDNLASDLLFYGRIETTLPRAKEAAKLAEKCITIAKSAYTDVVTEEKTTKDAKGKEKTIKVSKDGAKKLAARRKLLALLYSREEQRQKGEKADAFKARTGDIKHPLIEKLFEDYAPKYADRKGGYTRVLKTTVRRGDGATLAIVELV